MAGLFKKYFILFFLGFLVMVLFFLKFFYTGDNQKNEKGDLQIMPTIIKTLTLAPTPIIGDEVDDSVIKDEVVNVLPYRGKKMQITGYLKPGVLEIAIKSEEDKLEAESEVEEWMQIYPTFKDNSYVFVIKNN